MQNFKLLKENGTNDERRHTVKGVTESKIFQFSFIEIVWLVHHNSVQRKKTVFVIALSEHGLNTDL